MNWALVGQSAIVLFSVLIGWALGRDSSADTKDET